MYYEQKIKEMDIPRNLPLSVVMADVNGLKLTNDIFGHESGDLLLQKAAEVFQKVCREVDVIARIGGDEFVILMPNTKKHIAEAIVDQIKSFFSLEKIQAIKGSISMGADTKYDEIDDINHVISNAEIKMYSQKTLERGEAKESAIKSIVEMLRDNSLEEERHAQSVSRISEEIGRALHLPEMDIRKLKEAGLLHDIGKITLEKRLLDKYADLSEEEIRKVRQHPVIGYRILNSFDETLDIAGLVLAHHECWDGSGYPKGLKGDEIPLLARIIAAAEYYDTLMHRTAAAGEYREELKTQSGIKLDPQLVSILL
jgi:diguanylate cyclase (GGDEF)-like protein/putative nucleotidyltransferase with HDIG domain